MKSQQGSNFIRQAFFVFFTESPFLLLGSVRTHRAPLTLIFFGFDDDSSSEVILDCLVQHLGALSKNKVNILGTVFFLVFCLKSAVPSQSSLSLQRTLHHHYLNVMDKYYQNHLSHSLAAHFRRFLQKFPPLQCFFFMWAT